MKMAPKRDQSRGLESRLQALVRIQSNVPNVPRALFRGKQDQIVFYDLVHAVESGVCHKAAAGKDLYQV